MSDRKQASSTESVQLQMVEPVTPVAQLDSLTGLRFIAALAVIFVHSLNRALGRDAGYEQLAASAVTFFFVLSGFILTYVYSGRLTWTKIPEYLVARWARIWPLHVVCLCYAASVFMSRGYLPWTLETGWRFTTNLFLVQSWLPIIGWPFSFNGPAWSVSTELGFYLAFPLLLLMGRKRFWPVLLAVSVFSMCCLAWLQTRCNTDPGIWPLASEFSYCNPLVRVFDFVVGMATGKWFLWLKQKSRHGIPIYQCSTWRWLRDTLAEAVAIGLVLAVGWEASKRGDLHSWLVDKNWLLIDYWSLCGGALVLPFAGLIWVLAWSRGAISQVLSQPLLVWLGEVSYAFYLVQNPVIQTLAPWLKEANLPASVVVGMVIAISLAFAMLLHFSVELPFRTVLRECSVGGWRKARQALASIPGSLMGSGALLTAVAITFLALWVGQAEAEREKYRARLLRNQLVEQLEGKSFQRIEFDREATLLSCSKLESPQGVEFTLLWEIQPTISRGRFVHVTDAEGNIVFQPPLEFELFQKAEPGDWVTDRFAIPWEKLPENGRIGIGFYEKYLGTTPVKGEPLGMNGRRLEIYGLDNGSEKSESADWRASKADRVRSLK